MQHGRLQGYWENIKYFTENKFGQRKMLRHLQPVRDEDHEIQLGSQKIPCNNRIMKLK